jgi:SAM-dependent methyltransferase/chaperonin cofactor prefoldin
MASTEKRSKAARISGYPLRVAKQVYNLPKIAHELKTLEEVSDDIRKTLWDVKEEQAHLRNIGTATKDGHEALTHRLNQLDRRITDLNHRFAVLGEELQNAGAQKGKAAPAEPAAKKELLADEHLLDSFYVDFEHWFRGTPEEITERQKVYEPYFTGSKIDSKKYPAVDIGCGRGEFVALLNEWGVRGIGLDLNKAMVSYTKERGLEAVEGDALIYLSGLKSDSLMAVTGFHIVEHIPFIDLVRIFDECYRVLQPGGFVIFETPNPENLIVGTCNFYSDPSHLHPLPPAFLDFTLKNRGFNKTEIKRLNPIKPKITSTDKLVQEMAERMYGPQDYSVIAYK